MSDVCPICSDMAVGIAGDCPHHPPSAKPQGVRMANWTFTPSDFAGSGNRVLDSYAEPIADAANAKLAEWLKDAPRVYGTDIQGADWGDKQESCDRHTARLIAIEPIVRDTAESLLREFLAEVDRVGTYKEAGILISERARKLLEGE